MYICRLIAILWVYNIEPTCWIVKNDCVSSYTKLTNNVYRLCNLVESEYLSANFFPDCMWLWNRLLWGVTWGIITREHITDEICITYQGEHCMHCIVSHHYAKGCCNWEAYEQWGSRMAITALCVTHHFYSQYRVLKSTLKHYKH